MTPEREIVYKLVVLRGVQKPVHYKAPSFKILHNDLAVFARTGRMPTGFHAYELAFMAMQRFVVGHKYRVQSQGTSGRLYVSAESTRTIQTPSGRIVHDEF